MEAALPFERRVTIQGLSVRRHGMGLCVRAEALSLNRYGIDCMTDTCLNSLALVRLGIQLASPDTHFSFACDGLVLSSRRCENGWLTEIVFTVVGKETASHIQEFLCADDAPHPRVGLGKSGNRRRSGAPSGSQEAV